MQIKIKGAKYHVIDWMTQCCQDIHSSQIDLENHGNPDKLTAVFYRHW